MRQNTIDSSRVLFASTLSQTRKSSAHRLLAAAAAIEHLEPRQLLSVALGVNSGASAPIGSAAAAVVAPAARTTIPAAPSNLAATAVSSSQINLSWKDNSSNETGFKIERSTNGFTFSQIATVAANVTTYSNTGLRASTRYTYRVRAYNNAGNSSASATATATTQAVSTLPAAPSNLTATAASASQINLAWTDNSTNETGFKIQRSTDAGATFTQIATTAAGATTYSDTGLSASTTYTYRILATNANGDSAPTANATATTQAVPTLPAAPSNLTATAASASQINLAWTDNSTNETGFKIQRSPDGITFTQIATVAANVTAYSDIGLTASTPYTYRVLATNAVGDSAPTANATATTQPAPVMTPNYVVSPTGNDSAAGTADQPFKTVTKAMSVAQAGQVVLVKNGTYHESLNLSNSGTAGNPITLMGESTAGVVFDGTGLSSVIVANGASYITIQNITVRYAANGPQGYQAAVRTGDNWTLQDMVVERVDGTGVDVLGAHVTLLRVTAQYNGVAGIDGSFCTNAVIKDCVTCYNNNGMANPSWKNQTTIGGYPAATQINGLWYMNPDFEAGGGKWWQTSNVTIDGMQGYGNVGPAVWFDMDSTNAIIRNSSLHDNHGMTSALAYQGAGIEIEMQSAGPILLEANTLTNNDGAGVWLCDTTNTTVRNNTFVNDNILLKDDNRDANHPLRNDTITGNRFKNGYIETGIGTFSTTSGKDRGLIIDGDTYDNGGGTLMNWAAVAYNSLDTIRSVLGFEATGILGTVTP